jgi:hypothetical protein
MADGWITDESGNAITDETGISTPMDETSAVVAIRNNINEITPAFWTNVQLTNWLKLGCIATSTLVHCYENSADVTLVANTLEYTEPTDAGRVYACLYKVTAGGTYKALQKIHPRMLSRTEVETAGPPVYFYHFRKKLGVWPLPTATEIAAGGTLQVYFSQITDDINNIPTAFQGLPVLFATAKALRKDRRHEEADKYQAEFRESIPVYRQDLIERGSNSDDIMQIPSVGGQL